jgi:hypothetical protein
MSKFPVKGAVLADKPGLGKTFQGLVFAKVFMDSITSDPGDPVDKDWMDRDVRVEKFKDFISCCQSLKALAVNCLVPHINPSFP